MIKEVSLIIPNKSDEEKLSILLSSMLDWKATPNEIIIINTSSNEIFIPNDFIIMFCRRATMHTNSCNSS